MSIRRIFSSFLAGTMFVFLVCPAVVAAQETVKPPPITVGNARQVMQLGILQFSGNPSPDVIDWSPSVTWSPNSNFFASTSPNGLELYNADSLDSNPQVIEEPTDYLWWVAAWSPDGTMIVSDKYGMNDSVKLYNAETGELLWTLTEPNERAFVMWSPDGDSLASWSWPSGTVVWLWDAADGQQKSMLELFPAYSLSVSWSPDWSRIVIGGQNEPARVWDVATGNEVVALETIGIDQVTWSSDGATLATRSGNKVQLWEATTGGKLAELEFPDSSIYLTVTGITWSPTSPTLAFPVGDAIWVWSPTQDLQEPRIMQGHLGPVTSVAWSPDGTILASGGEDGTTRLWSVETGDELAVLEGHVGSVDQVRWSQMGNVLSSTGSDHSLRLWAVELK